MAITCSVCQQQLSNEIDKKNIFKDVLVIKSNFEKTEEKFKSDEKIKLYLAIELIIGRKISKSKGSPSNLCNQCFRKLEGYINFRAQILTSFGTTIQEQNSFHSLQQTFSNSKKEKQEEFFKEEELNDLIETSDCPKLPDNQLVSDDLINVDESSESLDLTTAFNNDDEDTNDFTNCNKIQTDQRNNNLNDSDSSNDNIDVCADSPARILNNDIESDIDVCSGDEDEILEIENTIENTNAKESEKSSDSEIEVCDYEPIGKRTRNLSAIYSAVNI